MRMALIAAVSTAAGLGACAPVPVQPYSYGYVAPAAPVAAAPYGYYGGGYAPEPLYAAPGYAAPYVEPGPTIIVGGERGYYGDRYRERPRYDGGYRNYGGGYGGYGGNRGYVNPQPGRDYGRQPGPQNFGGGRPGPSPVAVNRPPPAPVARAPVPNPPAGGRAFEQWNRANVNASPSQIDTGGSNR